jgi:ATP-dependent Clp protease ATP-binding subunit ClpA
MLERFAGATREKVRRAAELAEQEQASMVEVEHLLTALVDPVTDSVGRVLEAAGISGGSIRAARDREFRSALALVGVETGRPAPGAAPRQRRGRTTRFAPSAKLALERTLESAAATGQRRITNGTLVRAIISADVGIMPRLLDELGTNRERIAAMLEHDT